MEKRILLLLLGLGFFSFGFSQNIQLKNQKDSLSYSIGISMGESLLQTNIGQINEQIFFQALSQKLNKKPTLWGLKKADSLLLAYMEKKLEKLAKENKEKGVSFLEQNKKREGIYTTSSGLQYEILKMSEGKRPSLYSKVSCLYKGMHIDGRIFDAHLDREKPATIKLMDMIEGWIEGVQMMPIGGKFRFFIPSDLAYGKQGFQGIIDPNETLIFEIELLEILPE